MTKAAEMLGVTKNSVTRCFDELEALNIPYLKIRSRARQLSMVEKPACVMHEIGYYIEFADGKAMDPLSIVLSLSEEEKEYPRVSMAVDEMLEKYVWCASLVQ